MLHSFIIFVIFSILPFIVSQQEVGNPFNNDVFPPKLPLPNPQGSNSQLPNPQQNPPPANPAFPNPLNPNPQPAIPLFPNPQLPNPLFPNPQLPANPILNPQLPNPNPNPQPSPQFPNPIGRRFISRIQNATARIDMVIMYDFTTNQPRIRIEQRSLPPGDSYRWHLHIQDVADPLCVSTGTAHWDPTGRMPANPGAYTPMIGVLESYEVGDMSGKWGTLSANLNGQVVEYIDMTLLNTGIQPGWGARSIQLHSVNNNNAKVACANLVMS